MATFRVTTYDFEVGKARTGKGVLEQLLMDAEMDEFAKDDGMHYLAALTASPEENEGASTIVLAMLMGEAADFAKFDALEEASGLAEYASSSCVSGEQLQVSDMDWSLVDVKTNVVRIASYANGDADALTELYQESDPVSNFFVGEADGVTYACALVQSAERMAEVELEGGTAADGPRVMGRRQGTMTHGNLCAKEFIKILYTSKEGFPAPDFAALDTNGDGNISRDELNKGLIAAIDTPQRPFKGLSEKQLNDVFDFMDSDHDGTISPAEFEDLGKLYRTNSDAKAHADGDDWDVATGHVEAGRAIKAEKAKPARGQAKRGGAPSARGPSKDKVEIDWSAPTAVSTLNISLMDIANMEEALEDLGVDAVDKWGMTTLMHAAIWDDVEKQAKLIDMGAQSDVACTKERALNGNTIKVGETPADYMKGSPEPGY